MISTQFKEKLPRHLSYPIGAEAISEGLTNAPHVEAFSVTFSAQAVWPASEFRRLLSERGPYTIMKATYQPTCKPGISAARFMIEKGWYEEKWELHVFPVLAEFRHLANRLLREQGIPEIARWLTTLNQVGWGERFHCIELIFSSIEESLRVQERSGV